MLHIFIVLGLKRIFSFSGTGPGAASTRFPIPLLYHHHHILPVVVVVILLFLPPGNLLSHT